MLLQQNIARLLLPYKFPYIITLIFLSEDSILVHYSLQLFLFVEKAAISLYPLFSHQEEKRI